MTEGSNRRLVMALGGALAFSLLVIAFLLGRVTAKPPDAAAPTAEAAAPNAPASIVQEETNVAEPEADAPPSLEPAVDGEPADGMRDTAYWVPPAPLSALNTPTAENGSVRREPAPATASADQRAIAEYFAQIERIEDVGAGDPQAFATSMLQSVTSGDFSGFDDLLATARAQRQKLEEMSIPQICRDHHQLAMVLSGDSVEMLERLKTALMKGDATALMSMAAEGQTLEAQANKLKAMGEAIKRQALP